MKARFYIVAWSLIVTLSCMQRGLAQTITTESLLNDMVDFERLTRLSEETYKAVQYSSYDRRSTKPTDNFWFANEDGFGNEPIPGFEKVLKQPDANGIGEYLICDIRKPGAILRLWTAQITGKIRLFLDDMTSPVFEGDAQDFFWKAIEKLSDTPVQIDYVNTFRQFDAVYLPIPFARGCRIEWIGDIKETHFYHVGLRVYDSNVKVETFNVKEIPKYVQKMEEINRILRNPKDGVSNKKRTIQTKEISVPVASTKELFNITGQQAIEYFSVKLKANNPENALRKSLLKICFDDTSVPQIEVPIGDFFGAAPGLNPYQSLPFSVETDGTMTCRFVMPFKNAARIEIENNSDENITVSGGLGTTDYKWEDGKSMHFRARWKINHELTATNINAGDNRASDILYLMASGQGRIVGAAAYLYNPSNVPTPWGSWWGEGDEKIYVDQDTFPSFFGTGSEDYFNYSWSSAKIFSFPYCGQPRNDGPGNRGYVSNFRWHILDDIPFKDKIAFFMELGHHGNVPRFSYGRMVCLYASPELIDDYQKITIDDLRDISYRPWTPEAYLGSAGFRFIQAEMFIVENKTIKVENGSLWSEGSIVMWTPAKTAEKLKFMINSDKAGDKTNIGFTLAHSPNGGTMAIFINGMPVKFDGKETVNLFEPNQQILENHFSESIQLLKGNNEIIFESRDTEMGKKIGIDFVWMREK